MEEEEVEVESGDGARIAEIIAARGVGYVMGVLQRYCEARRDENNPNAQDDGRERAQHLGWRKDAETLEAARRALRH